MDPDHMELKYLAGGILVSSKPLYTPEGNNLLVLCNNVINVYSTLTGQLIRVLEGSEKSIVSFQFELKDPNTVVACTTAGEILRWTWSTGDLYARKKLNLPQGVVTTFNLVNAFANGEAACAFVTLKAPSTPYKWFLCNALTGKQIQTPLHLPLTHQPPQVAVDVTHFNYLVIAQGFYVYFVSYRKWTYKRYKNAHQVPVTAVSCSPSEEMAITGDEQGKVFTWREFDDKDKLSTSLYHWHHTSVSSLEFSTSGTSFYSSGQEAVLVKWNVNQPEIRNFLPRMNSVIRQIAVSDGNTQIAICTADNAIQIIKENNEVKATLQDFTYIADDKTRRDKFPVGMRLNPHNNSLVLNGRNGHLQFYSTHRKTLLYNVDITMQNALSMETEKILFNPRVEKAAFNINWMATGEVFNDEEHMPELRLKFWRFEETKQNYVLNTEVEFPHEICFRSIEFSSPYYTEKLMCATVGADNIIKMWALEEAEGVKREEKHTWNCISQTSYNDRDVHSLSFSQDGSLLAAGYGNTLCIFRSEDLAVKAVLSTAPGYDGQALDVAITVNGKPEQTEAEEERTNETLSAQRKKILQNFHRFINNDDDTLIQDIQREVRKNYRPLPINKLDNAMKEEIFHKVQGMMALNLDQKLLVYQKCGIGCSLPSGCESEMVSYLSSTVDEDSTRERLGNLQERASYVNIRDRYTTKHQLTRLLGKRAALDVKNKYLTPLKSLLSLSSAKNVPPAQRNGSRVPGGAEDGAEKNGMEAEMSSDDEDYSKLWPEPSKKPKISVPGFQESLVQIKHVQFAAGDSAHLVIACLEDRVLIWNMLTLRMQSMLKLRVTHMSFDPLTNLVACVTQSRDLHVFQPNVPLPLYQRRGLPVLHGLSWVPRRYPTHRSVNVEWQTTSTLYFLTKNQEIMYLTNGNDADVIHSARAAAGDSAVPNRMYTIFGTRPETRTAGTDTNEEDINSGPIVWGKSGQQAVSTLLSLPCHAMPPIHLLAGDFLKAMVPRAEAARGGDKKAESATDSESDDEEDKEEAVDGDGDVDMEDVESASRSMQYRQKMIAVSEEHKKKAEKEQKDFSEREMLLQSVAEMDIDFML